MGNPTGIHSAIRIRKAEPGDIESILRIENREFPDPWRKKYFIDETTHHLSYFYVAEEIDSKTVAGYIIFWIIEETSELHKIAVSSEYKGKGIGKRLFHFMLETAKTKKVEELFLEVRKSNTAAITLYESFGFILIDERKDYYSGPREDAAIYELMLPGKPAINEFF
jgi:[ribosomal protein S18]-alanine N-acetyltransferase